MSEWQPIETAPKDGTPILIWDGERSSVAWFDDEYVWVAPGAWISDYQRSDTYEHQPSHWLPLPTPPSA